MFASQRSYSVKQAIARQILQSFVNAGTRTCKQELKTFKENDALTVIGYENDGYVVIANDDNFQALIGYSDQPYLESNPGLNWWMNAMDKVLQTPQQTNANTTDEEGKKPISQLMTSEWGQDAPYNNLCPKAARGRCPSGCVATAMAQLLYYHKSPVKSEGTGSYTYDGKAFAQSLSGINYAWDKMQPKYDTPSGEGADDVATLLFDCGLALNMNYNDSGSSAYNFDACNAFTDNFCMYSTYFDRSYYTAADWMDIVYTQLSNHNPVVYGGVSKVDGQQSGHSFVIDGYDDKGLVHVNWGWNGTGNGYYDISLLNPVVETDSMSFSSNQDMVICQKEPFAIYSNIGMGSITVKQTTEGSITVNLTKVTNLLPHDFKGQLAIIAEKDGVKHVITSLNQKLIFGVVYSGIFAKTAYSIADLDDGLYKVYAAAKSDTDPDWQIFRSAHGGRNCYSLTKADGNISLQQDQNPWNTAIGHVTITTAVHRSAKTFSITGQEVDDSYHGIVIKNGMKYRQ